MPRRNRGRGATARRRQGAPCVYDVETLPTELLYAILEQLPIVWLYVTTLVSHAWGECALRIVKARWRSGDALLIDWFRRDHGPMLVLGFGLMHPPIYHAATSLDASIERRFLCIPRSFMNEVAVDGHEAVLFWLHDTIGVRWTKHILCEAALAGRTQTVGRLLAQCQAGGTYQIDEWDVAGALVCGGFTLAHQVWQVRREQPCAYPLGRRCKFNDHVIGVHTCGRATSNGWNESAVQVAVALGDVDAIRRLAAAACPLSPYAIMLALMLDRIDLVHAMGITTDNVFWSCARALYSTRTDFTAMPVPFAEEIACRASLFGIFEETRACGSELAVRLIRMRMLQRGLVMQWHETGPLSADINACFVGRPQPLVSAPMASQRAFVWSTYPSAEPDDLTSPIDSARDSEVLPRIAPRSDNALLGSVIRAASDNAGQRVDVQSLLGAPTQRQQRRARDQERRGRQRRGR